MTPVSELSCRELLREIVDLNAPARRNPRHPFENQPEGWLQRIRAQIIDFARAPCSRGLRGEDVADAYVRVAWIQSFVEQQTRMGSLVYTWRGINVGLFNRLWTILRKMMSLEHDGADVWDAVRTQELDRSRLSSNNTSHACLTSESRKGRAGHVIPEALSGANATAIVTPLDDQVAPSTTFIHHSTPTSDPHSLRRSPTPFTKRRPSPSRTASAPASAISCVMEREAVCTPSASLERAPSLGKTEGAADKSPIDDAVVPASHDLPRSVTSSPAPASPRCHPQSHDLTSSTPRLLLRYLGHTFAIPYGNFCALPDQVGTANLDALYHQLRAQLKPPFHPREHKVVYIGADAFQIETDHELQDCLQYASDFEGVQFEVRHRRRPEQVHVQGLNGTHDIALDSLLDTAGSLPSARMCRLWSALSSSSGVEADDNSHLLTYRMSFEDHLFVLETDDDLYSALVYCLPTGSVRFDVRVRPAAPARLPSSQITSTAESIPRNTDTACSLPVQQPDHLVVCKGMKLAPDQMQIVATALSAPSSTWIFTDDFGVNHILTSQGLNSVIGRACGSSQGPLNNWLNDEIIDAHLAVSVRDYNRGLQTPQGVNEACMALSSFFLSSVIAGQLSDWVGHLRQRDATILQANGHSLANMRVLFFPFNRSNAHWSLIIALPAERKLIVKDSSPNASAMQKGIHAVRQLLGSVLGGTEPWEVDSSRTGPRQRNSNDCGAYVCLNAQLYLRSLSLGTDRPTPIVASQVQEGRRLIAYEVLANSSLESSLEI